MWLRSFVLRHLAPKVHVVVKGDGGGDFRHFGGAAAIVEERPEDRVWGLELEGSLQQGSAICFGVAAVE